MATLDMVVLPPYRQHTADTCADTQHLEVPTSTPLPDLLLALHHAVRFPGRLRVLGDAGLADRLPWLPAAVEWVGVGARMVLGAASGTAFCEAARGGEVLVLGDAQCRTAAGELGIAPGLSNLSVLAIADDRMLISPSERAARILGADGGLTWPPDAARAPNGAGVRPAAGWLRRREWPPVQLASLGRFGNCPWPATGSVALGAQLLAGCRFLAAREPALLVAQDATPWAQVPLTPGVLMALAQVAGEGRRVVVGISPALLGRCGPELAVISRRGLALKLLCPWTEAGGDPAAVLPELVGDGPLGRWWVQGSADPAEAEAILAQLLAHEDPALLLYAEAPPADAALQNQPYARAQAWAPGSGRLVAPGDQALVIGSGMATPAALALRARLQAQGVSVAVWQCTSLAPLPLVDLRALIAHWRETHAANSLLCLDPDGGAVARALTATLAAALPVANGIAEAEDLLRAACAR